MNKVKFFDVTINSESAVFSMSPTIPTIDDLCQPMELIFCIEYEKKKKPIIMEFNKDEANELLKELQRLVPLINCFG